MTRSWTFVAALSSAILTTGCANWMTSTKRIDLEKSSYAIDVKQRIAFVKSRPGFKPEEPAGRVICTEPSPDHHHAARRI